MTTDEKGRDEVVHRHNRPNRKEHGPRDFLTEAQKSPSHYNFHGLSSFQQQVS